MGAFLAILEHFGSLTSPGMLSFPREGVKLVLDFPNKGARGMPGALFRSGYPRWQECSHYIDPVCSSSFWRRATENV
jgi:hypothetical protein